MRYTKTDVHTALVRFVRALRESGHDIAALTGDKRAREIAAVLSVPVAAFDPERGDYGERIAMGLHCNHIYGGWVLLEVRPGCSGEWNPSGTARVGTAAMVRELNAASFGAELATKGGALMPFVDYEPAGPVVVSPDEITVETEAGPVRMYVETTGAAVAIRWADVHPWEDDAVIGSVGLDWVSCGMDDHARAEGLSATLRLIDLARGLLGVRS